MQYIWNQGKVEKLDSFQGISPLNHSLHYGSAVFEGIRFYSLSRGISIFRLGDHVQRLMDSAELLQFSLPYDRNYLCEATLELVQRSGLKSGYVRPFAYINNGLEGLASDGLGSDVSILVWDWKVPFQPFEKRAKRLFLSHYRRPDGRSAVPQAKAAGNYIISRMAYREARRLGFDDALMLDVNDYVSEGTAQNVFIVRDQTLITPPIQTCLKGITRDSVMTLARSKDIAVEERNFSAEELFQAQEVFLTSTAAEIVPVISVGHHMFESAKAGSMTSLLFHSFQEVINGDHLLSSEWNTYL